ncbi:MAG: ABC transporter permease [Candidatus Nitricoxidivorans perseverans]|uniref:ABC transporter permease n=1 Tax=Candidatus Nitricoxidivorans perseverans TaxID=2975601 RepID=A0AA49FNB4_9PROT|nr:MAG: ABC transporter permease [Candidatus Nitricoxidivorans perseverans]
MLNTKDFILLSLRALTAHRLRSFLTLLGIAVGIAAVILLTSIGEGVHRFVLSEFTQFGSNGIEIAPGRTVASGGPGGLQTTVRLLTLDDARALERVPDVLAVTPVVWGNSEVNANGRLRRTSVYGTGPHMDRVFAMKVRTGRFLPAEEMEHARPFAVLGPKVREELFGAGPALGQRLRIGGMQFRIVGVMEPKGQFLGIDLDDTVYIPAAQALALYNREGLMRINLAYREGADVTRVTAAVKSVLKARHGREDFTVITQDDMLRTLSKILNVLTAAVGALGGISLLVGGVGIVTIMTIAVAERTNEIGLLKALGAPARTILGLFLGEAVALAALGGAFGLALGMGVAQLLHLFLPALPVETPVSFVLLAEGLSVAIGLAAGVLPARRAAQLDPVEALRAE